MKGAESRFVYYLAGVFIVSSPLSVASEMDSAGPAKYVRLGTTALIVLIALAGLTYEAYADAAAAREFPPPGTMVDIGGRRLHLVCIGRDHPMEPTVMVLASGWGNAMSSSRVRESRTRRRPVSRWSPGS